ncbi:MAG: hypothetical protein LRS46_01650 [Desulfurococcales archaeon]|nr:hypothetical protein [Desulfurococcales archaeon]
MRSRNETVTVKVDGSRVDVAGRAYESAHVMILGADALEMSVTPYRVHVSARFRELPQVEDSTPYLLRISAPGASLRLDLEGSSIRRIREDGGISVEADLLTMKFESSELGDKVVVRIPGFEPIRVEKLNVRSNTTTSINSITDPFIVGVLTIERSKETKIRVHKDKEVIIEAH